MVEKSRSQMPTDDNPSPKSYLGVTISSTFTDLQEHRAALIKILHSNGMMAVAMENDSAKLDDIIGSSLQMVGDGSAYIGIVSHRYGNVPECPVRNPNGLSITELEFDEATRLHRPILLFVMGEDHPITKKDVETDPVLIQKLAAFLKKARSHLINA